MNNVPATFSIAKSCFQLGRRCVGSMDSLSTGYLDNVRVWNRVLNASEIALDMINAQADRRGLIGSWDGTLDDLGNLQDFSKNNNSGVFNTTNGPATTIICQNHTVLGT